MNDRRLPVAEVLESIDAAAAAGLSPIKINMVVKRGGERRTAFWRWPSAGAAADTSCGSSSSWTSQHERLADG